MISIYLHYFLDNIKTHTMFKDEWLRMPKYPCVRKASKFTEFRCQLCEPTCKLSDLGSAALDSHARGKKHKAKERSKEQ